MSRIAEIFKDENELRYFSELVHQYEKLASMRCMQILRERHQLTPDESKEIIVSIVGRQMNEAAYSCCGILMGCEMKVEELLPISTINLLSNLLDGKLTDPKFRKDICTDVRSFKKFISELYEETDLPGAMTDPFNPEGRKSYQPASEEDNIQASKDGLEIYTLLISKYPHRNVNDFDSIMNAQLFAFLIMIKNNVMKEEQKPFLQMIYKNLLNNL